MPKFVAAPKSIPPFAALRAFQAVGSLDGIRKAAEAINVDHTVISRHVKTLEEWLGVPLLTRVGRGVRLTEQGVIYHARISSALAEICDATDEISRFTRHNSLRIRSLPGFGFLWLAGNLHKFRSAAPQLNIDLHLTDDAADFFADGVDVDLRFSLDPEFLPPAGCSSVRIADPLCFVVGSPTFLAKMPAVRAPQDILDFPLLHEDDDRQWRRWFNLHGIEVAQELKGPSLWHAHVILEAARAGQGLSLANMLLIRDDLQTGRLVLVGEEAQGFPLPLGAYHFVARRDRWNESNISKFRRWVLSTASEDLQRGPGPPPDLPEPVAKG